LRQDVFTMARKVIEVFLSSTALDLAPYRIAVRDRLENTGLFHCIQQEDFGVQDASAIEFCRKQVQACDIFVGLVGQRRGWEPDGDQQRRSITEMEHDWAAEAGRRCFLWVTPDDFRLPSKIRDSDGNYTRQMAFRQRLMAGGIVSQQGFDNADLLASEIVEHLLAYVVTSDLVNAENDAFDRVIIQRPAAFRFGVRNGKIDALPDRSPVADAETARDLRSELLAKVEALRERLAQTNSNRRVLDSVSRLLKTLGSTLADVRAGLLLSRVRSIEADRNAFHTKKARQELFPEAIAMMDDLLLSARDLLAIFPIIREIEAEQMALAIPHHASALRAIRRDTDAIKQAAAASEAVTEDAVAALKEQDADIETAPNTVVRARLVADQLLVFRNFVNEVFQAARASGRAAGATFGPGLRRAGSELGDLGEKSWQQFKENFPQGVGLAARLLPLGALAALLAGIAGPVGGLAALSGGFKEIAKAIKKFARRGNDAKAPKQLKRKAKRGPKREPQAHSDA
jgi:hypothetical protein